MDAVGKTCGAVRRVRKRETWQNKREARHNRNPGVGKRGFSTGEGLAFESRWQGDRIEKRTARRVAKPCSWPRLRRRRRGGRSPRAFFRKFLAIIVGNLGANQTTMRHGEWHPHNACGFIDPLLLVPRARRRSSDLPRPEAGAPRIRRRGRLSLRFTVAQTGTDGFAAWFHVEKAAAGERWRRTTLRIPLALAAPDLGGQAGFGPA